MTDRTKRPGTRERALAMAVAEAETATRQEYDALVMQVASWCMRAHARDPYAPLKELAQRFADDVLRLISGS